MSDQRNVIKFRIYVLHTYFGELIKFDISNLIRSIKFTLPDQAILIRFASYCEEIYVLTPYFRNPTKESHLGYLNKKRDTRENSIINACFIIKRESDSGLPG